MRPSKPFYRFTFACLCAAAALLTCGCTSLAFTPNRLSVPEVIKLSKSGMESHEIIRRMMVYGTVYRLAPEQVVALKRQGVCEEVLEYMQQTYAQTVKQDKTFLADRNWQTLGGYNYGNMHAANIDGLMADITIR